MNELGTLSSELGHLRRHWWWFTLLGAVLVLGGAAAISCPFLASLNFVMVLGIILLISGVATVIGSFWAGKWSAFLLQVLVGIIYAMIGISIAEEPLRSSAALTLLIASFMIVVGVFRVIAALSIRYPQWGWGLFNGVVTLLAGVLIYRHFPESASWVIGLVVGLELLFNGISWIMLSLAIRPRGDAVERP
jgi:uncharacterized membrane protein HdeD (DUF308 family)